MIITDIKEADIYQVLEIYRPYITDTRITFEYEAPDLETFTAITQSNFPGWWQRMVKKSGATVTHRFTGGAWPINGTVNCPSMWTGTAGGKGSGKDSTQSLWRS